MSADDKFGQTAKTGLLSWLNVLGPLVLGGLMFWLNLQIQYSNENLNRIKNIQSQQQIMLEEQKTDLQFRLDLFDRVVQCVARNDDSSKQTQVVLALVTTLPATDYSHALLKVLTTSPQKDISEEAIITLLKRNENVIHKQYTEDTKIFPDLDIFICREALTEEGIGDLLQNVLAAVDKVKSGQIRIRLWTSDSEFSYKHLANKTTLIVDKDHPENAYAEEVRTALRNVPDIPKIELVTNPGKTTPYTVSVVICPE